MAVLSSVDELEALLNDRPDETRTYQLDPSAAADLLRVIRSADSGSKAREMDSAEVEELARYLQMPVEELQRPLTVSAIACSGCGRWLTILDIAKTGVDDGFHSKARLADVLSGRAGQFVTVRGKDGGRFANCSSCSRKSDTPIFVYTCGVNAYAWA
jgi:hypothetical protein